MYGYLFVGLYADSAVQRGILITRGSSSQLRTIFRPLERRSPPGLLTGSQSLAHKAGRSDSATAVAIAQNARNCYYFSPRDIRAARWRLKVGVLAASIESDGGLRLEYPEGCFGIYARIPPDRQLAVW